MKNLLLLTLCMLASLSGYADGKGDEAWIANLKDLQSRKLMVILSEEHPDVATFYAKNKEGIERYKKGLELYNSNIKDVIQKHWTFNKDIEYIKMSEVENYAKTNKAVFLMPATITDGSLSYSCHFGAIEHPAYMSSALILMPSEAIQQFAIRKKRVLNEKYGLDGGLAHNHPYETLPVFFALDDKGKIDQKKIGKSSLIVAVRLMQERMTYALEKNTKIDRFDFYATVTEERCAQLQASTLLIPKSIVQPDLDEATIKSSLGKQEYMIVAEDLAMTLLEEASASGQCMVLTVPGMMVQTAGGGVQTSGQTSASASYAIEKLVHFKLVISLENYSLVSAHGLVLGENMKNQVFIKKINLSKISSCKSK